MTVDWNLVASISMPIITLFLGALLNKLIESREKLIAHLGYISSHRVRSAEPDGEPTLVNTHSVIIKNTGRKAAKNVRLGHTFLPDVNVFPDVDYTTNPLPGGGTEIVFPTLAPKKEVTVSYLYFPPDTWERVNTHIESDEGPAKIVQVLLQQQPKPWQLKIIWFLIIVGLIATVYGLVEAIKWYAI